MNKNEDVLRIIGSVQLLWVTSFIAGTTKIIKNHNINNNKKKHTKRNKLAHFEDAKRAIYQSDIGPYRIRTRILFYTPYFKPSARAQQWSLYRYCHLSKARFLKPERSKDSADPRKLDSDRGYCYRPAMAIYALPFIVMAVPSLIFMC